MFLWMGITSSLFGNNLVECQLSGGARLKVEQEERIETTRWLLEKKNGELFSLGFELQSLPEVCELLPSPDFTFLAVITLEKN